ncbi:MAG TPA: acyltransferase [Polyangiaceae bacterium]|jgi:peptidoglycan/LPS O-acetylase OafA/YrhL|nr:acyltransferase [Polyangiaceae bacterium]
MASAVPVATTQESTALRRFLELDLLDNRYPALHGMRVLGVVSVVQWHVTQIFKVYNDLPMSPSMATASMAVFFGMDMFFVLSGFLIGSILLRSIETSGKTQVRRFYVRRVFRTFPSYYLVLTYLVLTTALTANQRHNLPFEYTYLTNYQSNHRDDIVMPWGWSLALEEQFYLVVPFLFFALRKIEGDVARLGLLVVLWSSTFFTRLVIYLHPYGIGSGTAFVDMYTRTHTRCDTLVCGIILAYVHFRWKAPITAWLQSPRARAALALPSLGCLWIIVQPTMFGQSAVRLVEVFSWGTLTSIMYFGWVMLILHGGDGWTRRALSWPGFRRLATLGYGVYLVHIPVCYALITPSAKRLSEQGWSMAAVWPLSVLLLVAASLGFAYVLHVLVEKPALRLRDRVAR